MKTVIIENQIALAPQRGEPQQKQNVDDVREWKYRETICPVCGNKFF